MFPCPFRVCPRNFVFVLCGNIWFVHVWYSVFCPSSLLSSPKKEARGWLLSSLRIAAIARGLAVRLLPPLAPTRVPKTSGTRTRERARERTQGKAESHRWTTAVFCTYRNILNSEREWRVHTVNHNTRRFRKTREKHLWFTTINSTHM